MLVAIVLYRVALLIMGLGQTAVQAASSFHLDSLTQLVSNIYTGSFAAGVVVRLLATAVSVCMSDGLYSCLW